MTYFSFVQTSEYARETLQTSYKYPKYPIKSKNNPQLLQTAQPKFTS